MQNDLIFVLTGLVVLIGGFLAFRRSRDPLHPGVFLAPLLAGGYAVWPLALNRGGAIEDLFGSTLVEKVATLYACSLFAFYVGLLHSARVARRLRADPESGRRNAFAWTIEEVQRRHIYRTALFLGSLAVAAYWYTLSAVGGFFEAYSRHKGGGYATSGYVGEAGLLAYPGIILLAIARNRRRIRPIDVLAAIFLASPHLLQGIVGGRRGPLFLVFATLFLAWYLAKGSPPTLRTAAAGMATIVVAVIFVWTQRQHVYLGSEGAVDVSRVQTVLEPEDLRQNDYVSGITSVLTADHFGRFYWGYRYLVTVLIRPIPRQLWPTKYEDVGATWLGQFEKDEGGAETFEAVGFYSPMGSSIGFIADLYQEFWWFCVVVTYLFGRLHAWCWLKHRLQGGLWTLLFCEMLMLAIYVPTQSFSAWFHRYLFMAFFSILFWNWSIRAPRASRRVGAARLA